MSKKPNLPPGTTNEELAYATFLKITSANKAFASAKWMPRFLTVLSSIFITDEVTDPTLLQRMGLPSGPSEAPHASLSDVQQLKLLFDQLWQNNDTGPAGEAIRSRVLPALKEKVDTLFYQAKNMEVWYTNLMQHWQAAAAAQEELNHTVKLTSNL
jgi:hypothetical protein